MSENKDIAQLVEERLRKAQENKEFKDTEGRIGGSKKERMAYKVINVTKTRGGGAIAH